MSIQRILAIGLGNEQDIVLVRQRARQVSSLLGFSQQDQVRIATAVSEVARGACQVSVGSRASFAIGEVERRQVLEVTIDVGNVASGPLPDDAIVTAHRLMEECDVQRGGPGASAGASRITMRKALPLQAYVNNARLGEIAAQLAQDSPSANSYLEVQLQNRELVTTLAELRERQEDLLSLARELEDTNRGIVALYAEIEDKAERLRRADEMKSRFLSNTSHELRTPLSSIRALAKLLLDRMDGELTVEQERQVRYIEAAATDLSELVNDLLDLAKIEAGKVDILLAPVVVDNLFRALKGMLRPLVDDEHVELLFDAPDDMPAFESDEGKISQVLRNFISNALKFTERGTVRVSATHDREADTIVLAVSDSGIGISPDNLLLIFEEFSQIEHPLQRRSKGTGLGLPLCRKLADLLGGRVEVTSQVGAGSTFSLVLPRVPRPEDSEEIR
jgi:signal transduction histidine kinase